MLMTLTGRTVEILDDGKAVVVIESLRLGLEAYS